MSVMRYRNRWSAVTLGAAVLVLAGCGGSPDQAPAGSPAGTTSPAVSATATPEQAPSTVTATPEVVLPGSDAMAPAGVPDPPPRSVPQQQAPVQSAAPPALPDPGFEPRAGY
ncbi:hypothetical protein [Nocardia mangyaensis]|uniref:hypothetical protein n=1 Tax=Nocardia mangyaensis TaxID=2213200 RepID=UPI0012EB1083|nr:hypothetical protein [Nocardia mangyaensis]